MAIYVGSNVTIREDEYVDFLIRNCGYLKIEAEARRWEIEYQIKRRCKPILMRPNTSGTIKFKSVLQRQEIERLEGNIPQLTHIVNRRRGNMSNAQWLADYYVSTNGDIFILNLNCYNALSEDINNEDIIDKNTMNTNKKVIRLTESYLKNIIAESVKQVLNEGCWYGNTKPFESIIIACNEIKDKFEYVNDENYEDDSDDHSNIEYNIYQWADKISQEAEGWLGCNATNRPIGEYPY